jgi:hypothetical protein
MKHFFLFFFLIFSQISLSFGQQVTVSGYISDEASSEKLVGANLLS